MTRRVAVIAGLALAVVVATWLFVGGGGKGDASSSPAGDTARAAAAPVEESPGRLRRAVDEPLAHPPVPRLRVRAATPEEPLVLDGDALFERAPVAAHYISRAIGGTDMIARDIQRCADVVRATLTGAQYFRFDLQLHIVSVDGAATIESADSDDWPEAFSTEARECFLDLYRGTQFDTAGDGEGGDYPPADDFDYVIVHPMGMNLRGRAD